MGFLYFVPNHKFGVVKREHMESLGLEYALTTGDPDSRQVGRGPGDTAGVLAAPQPFGGGAVACEFQPARQTWRKGPPSKIAGVPGPAYWVGVWNDQRPGPEQLRRERVYDGSPVKLLDGNEWIVPRCHAVLDGRPPTLPRVLDIADDGETVITKPNPAYAALCDDAFTWWMHWSDQSDESSRMTPADQIRLAVAALAVNYRVGRIEAIGLLGLWGTDEFGLILRAIIDADEVEAFFERSRQTPGT